jgi:hypothetical protein
MDRIEFAERQYKRIISSADLAWSEFPHRKLQVWLKDDVVPIVEEFSRRPAFRRHATWPLEVLIPGSNTDERRAVEAVDSALVTSAGCISRLATNKLVARAMEAQNPPRKEIVDAALVISDTGIHRKRADQIIDDLPVRRNQVQQIARRPWIDLVCADDYFSASRGLNFQVKQARRAEGDSIVKPNPAQDVHPIHVVIRPTQGEFVVSFNPELHPVGDFVTRSMLRRVEVWLSRLGDFRKLCHQALRNVKRGYLGQVEVEAKAWNDLEARVAELRRVCTTAPAASLHDSCIILTQVYAAFHPTPILTWLGLPESVVSFGVSSLHHRIIGERRLEPLERIATAVGDLRHLYPEGEPEESALDEAVATGGLVLADLSRSAHWETKRIPADWDRFDKPWQLLWMLATKAHLHAGVEVRDVYDNDAVTDSALSTLVGRLKRMLPPTLRRLIHPTRQRSYRLHLAPEHIHLHK